MSDNLQALVLRIDSLEKRIAALEPNAGGYDCRTCGKHRPPSWYIYEIEVDGAFAHPCCGECARIEGRTTRGPFKQNIKGERS